MTGTVFSCACSRSFIVRSRLVGVKVGPLRRVSLVVLLALALAPAARAGGPSMVIGAAEDGVRAASVAEAKAKLDLLRLGGLRAVRVTTIWAPGLTAPTGDDQANLATLAAAAQLDGIRLYVTVMPFGSKTTPLTEQDQTDFATYAAS